MARADILSPSARSHTPWLYGLGALVLIEVLWFPTLATAAYTFFSGRGGWDGSALGYVQRYRVVPVGALFWLLIMTVAVRSTVQNRPLHRRVAIGAWVMNLVLVLSCVLWYARLAD